MSNSGIVLYKYALLLLLFLLLLLLYQQDLKKALYVCFKRGRLLLQILLLWLAVVCGGRVCARSRLPAFRRPFSVFYPPCAFEFDTIRLLVPPSCSLRRFYSSPFNDFAAIWDFSRFRVAEVSCLHRLCGWLSRSFCRGLLVTSRRLTWPPDTIFFQGLSSSSAPVAQWHSLQEWFCCFVVRDPCTFPFSHFHISFSHNIVCCCRGQVDP